MSVFIYYGAHCNVFFYYSYVNTCIFFTQPQLQEERDRLSADAVSQLRRYGEEMQKMENVIYTTGCKLKAVLKENDRFINVRIFN